MPERNCVFIPIDRLGLGMDVPAPKMKADTSFTFLRSRATQSENGRPHCGLHKHLQRRFSVI